MGKVFILLVVYHLHGGLITTKSLTAPSYEQCKANGPTIIREDIKRGMMLGDRHIDIEDGKSICLVFE